MGRPKKNNKISESEKKDSEVLKKQLSEEIQKDTVIKSNEKHQEEVAEKLDSKQFIENIVYTNDNQPKDTSNFKQVQVMKPSELEYFRKRSEVISRLKKDSKYKFLSIVSLTKIADIYMQKNY